jgi:hypothetical protein
MQTEFDLMNVIEEDDRKLLENNRINNMKRGDWGKAMAVPNQYIHRNLLNYHLQKHGCRVYSTDDADLPAEVSIANNSPGFDLIIVLPDGKIKTVQSKLRQIDGITDYSKQIHFETTRRNSKKNQDKNHTGHICYSLNEFDYVMISLVNDRENTNKRKNCNLWSFCIIPISELEDTKHPGCCMSHITSKIVEQNIVNMHTDISYKFIQDVDVGVDVNLLI